MIIPYWSRHWWVRWLWRHRWSLRRICPVLQGKREDHRSSGIAQIPENKFIKRPCSNLTRLLTLTPAASANPPPRRSTTLQGKDSWKTPMNNLQIFYLHYLNGSPVEQSLRSLVLLATHLLCNFNIYVVVDSHDYSRKFGHFSGRTNRIMTMKTAEVASVTYLQRRIFVSYDSELYCTGPFTLSYIQCSPKNLVR